MFLVQQSSNSAKEGLGNELSLYFESLVST